MLFAVEIERATLSQDVTCMILESNYTVYHIRVQTLNSNPNKVWNVKRRYTDFVELDQCLREQELIHGFRVPPLPVKRLFKMSEATVQERIRGLENYLHAIVSDAALCSSPFVRQFLTLREEERENEDDQEEGNDEETAFWKRRQNSARRYFAKMAKEEERRTGRGIFKSKEFQMYPDGGGGGGGGSYNNNYDDDDDDDDEDEREVDDNGLHGVFDSRNSSNFNNNNNNRNRPSSSSSSYLSDRFSQNSRNQSASSAGAASTLPGSGRSNNNNNNNSNRSEGRPSSASQRNTSIAAALQLVEQLVSENSNAHSVSSLHHPISVGPGELVRLHSLLQQSQEEFTLQSMKLNVATRELTVASKMLAALHPVKPSPRDFKL